MDREQVVGALRENEQVVAIRWCGQAGARRPLAELRKLRDELREKQDDSYELTLTSLDRQSQVVALTLCERYDLRAFRRKGQRRTTMIVRGPKMFVKKIFEPLIVSHMEVLVRASDAWLHDLLTRYEAAESSAAEI